MYQVRHLEDRLADIHGWRYGFGDITEYVHLHSIGSHPGGSLTLYTLFFLADIT